ncbi:unnamed protein product [Bemisia tabaci]|uniref:Ig-like domain-containing protein n=1 Tax=Bemisia tabaci TaxID=7038 RepID=A0A9P0AG83_BEMTA|nr:unnamed protein product [Bemisia tabaci]
MPWPTRRRGSATDAGRGVAGGRKEAIFPDEHTSIPARCGYFPEPVTTIIGGTELYINRGSTMNLTCVIKHSPEPPSLIYWTHDTKELESQKVTKICLKLRELSAGETSDE